ncbi:MAG: preprotein translocase subunit SecE [Anaerolineae bacterium]|nr:preprotein translocase subunit SecE [Anaerolineae bacterium]
MATETKKDRKKSKSKDGNFLTSMMDGTRTYIGEVRSELKKVSWPERPGCHSSNADCADCHHYIWVGIGSDEFWFFSTYQIRYRRRYE